MKKNQHAIKAASLLTLTLQNAALALSMRYSRTRSGSGNLFLPSTAVLLAEIVKCACSLFFVYYYESFGVQHCFKTVYNTVFKQPLDTLKVCIPAMAYIIQNNLLYVSASHLDAATYQVTYQLKILTTAIFTVLMLDRRLNMRQWSSLLLLICGVALVQLSEVTDQTPSSNKQNRLIGMAAALSACCISGFAGVFFEKILKGSEISIWMRNLQLSVLSIPLSILPCVVSNWNEILTDGFFQGYDYFVVYLILMQALGGLLVAVVIKYADNILKGFATSLSIICSCIFSVYFFGFRINLQFVNGTVLVILSVFLYSKLPTSSAKQPDMSIKRLFYSKFYNIGEN